MCFGLLGRGRALPFDSVDLNADLGEGFGVWHRTDDEALLDVVTSANVACGFHAGDPHTMRRVCALAGATGVTIGAQVSYRDLPGFGQRRIEYDPDELRDDVLYQLAALDGFARVAGSRVKYVKPHGALYQTVVSDEAQASAVVTAVIEYDLTLAVLGLPGSAFLRLAERAGLRCVLEGFADRGYLPDGRLVPRSSAGACGTDGNQGRGGRGRGARIRRPSRSHRAGRPSANGLDISPSRSPQSCYATGSFT